ncbi:MAG TPA: GTP-binding protein, partial [Gemmataceae bacterium]|nr:GTP-binding protein [Gemmataceae bacterium]
MAKHKVEDVRNIALVGHGAAGKTSLADTLLFKAGTVDRRGSVDDGSSVSDYDDEEKKRHFSIDTSVLHLEHKGKSVHLLDTPGYPDFIGAALEALDPVETAVVVISAPNGVEVNTRRMFNEAGKRGLARMLIINKMDADNIRFDTLLNTITGTFGKGCVLLNAPIGTGAQFSGVVNVLSPPPAPPPGCLVDLAQARSKLLDAIVEYDEGLMEKYLMEGDIGGEELTAALPKALAAGTVIPIFCTSAKKEIGVTELLESLCAYALSPGQGRKRIGTKGQGEKAAQVTLEPSESAEFVGQVFKMLSDKFVGNLSYFRVYSGKVTAEQPLVNVRTGKSARSGGLLLMQGK